MDNMESAFIRELGHKAELSPRMIEVLDEADVTDYESLFSLVTSFPSLARSGIDVTRLSNIALKHMGGTAKAAQRFVASTPKKHKSGARPPDRPAPPSGKARLQVTRRPTVVAGPSIDLRCPSWPVRDQGDRGTCVAFAVAASIEHHECGGANDLAEQYLYWAIKAHDIDPEPDEDGTTLDCANRALQLHGICNEHLWPYNPVFSKPVSHANGSCPSSDAVVDAHNRKRNGTYSSSVNPSDLRALLEAGRMVALTLPVFSDPIDPDRNNWNAFGAEEYGRIQYPPPGALAVAGHAVCVTGFESDPGEKSGGFFIFRNSWGDGWAHNRSGRRSHSPEPGYGYVSVRYVTDYGWEQFAP